MLVSSAYELNDKNRIELLRKYLDHYPDTPYANRIYSLLASCYFYEGKIRWGYGTLQLYRPRFAKQWGTGRPQPRSPSLLMTQIATITSTIPTSWNSVGISPKNRILAVTGITIPSFANADDRTAPFSRMHFCIRTRFPVNKNPFTIPVRTAVRHACRKDIFIWKQNKRHHQAGHIISNQNPISVIAERLTDPTAPAPGTRWKDRKNQINHTYL